MVRCGIDRIDAFSHLFQGKVLGMVTSVSGVTLDLRPSYAVFHERYPLSCLFSPEHGLHAQFANGQEVPEQPVDPLTGAPVISLFGNFTAKHIPDPWLQKLDAVVYDIQDLGTRFYTYIATMIHVMEDCAAAGIELIILDRPNLLGGEVVEGGMLDPKYHSFVSPYSLPIRYGLTVGELARMVNDEQHFSCRLHVVPCEGWDRTQMFPDFGNHWVKPSGAIGDFETALLYPGMCLFEGTNLSEGRGTGSPFRLVGAPFLNGERLSGEMNALALPGVAFAPAAFRPTASKFKGENCQGVAIHVTDPAAFRSVRTGITLLYKILELWPGTVTYPAADWSQAPLISFLSGCDIFEGPLPPLEQLLQAWAQDCRCFEERKRKYHIYPETHKEAQQ